VIAAGTPEEVVAESASHTGRFLAELLGPVGSSKGSTLAKRASARRTSAKRPPAKGGGGASASAKRNGATGAKRRARPTA